MEIDLIFLCCFGVFERRCGAFGVWTCGFFFLLFLLRVVVVRGIRREIARDRENRKNRNIKL